MLSQITTKSFNVYLNNDVIVSAKCRSTGRFVKRAIAQVELQAELIARANLNNNVSFIEEVKASREAHIKQYNHNKAIVSVKNAVEQSLVEKAKVQLQASIAKVAMLGVITLSAFNFA